jgi:hypothetical protein
MVGKFRVHALKRSFLELLKFEGIQNLFAASFEEVEVKVIAETLV